MDKHYPLDTDLFANLTTLIGVGTFGMAVVEHLYNIGVQDVKFMVCSSASDALQASVVPGKALFSTDGVGSESESDNALAAAVVRNAAPSSLFVVVADLNESIGVRLVPVFMEAVRDGAQTGVATVVEPVESEQPDRVNDVLAKLQSCCGLFFRARPADPQGLMYDLSDSVAVVASLGCTVGTYTHPDDIQQILEFLQPAGPIAAVRSTAGGRDRATRAVDKAVAALQRQPFAAGLTERVILVMSSSPDFPLSLQERTAITDQITNLLGKQPSGYKVGLIDDNLMDDEVTLSLMLGQPSGARPLAEPHV